MNLIKLFISNKWTKHRNKTATHLYSAFCSSIAYSKTFRFDNLHFNKTIIRYTLSSEEIADSKNYLDANVYLTPRITHATVVRTLISNDCAKQILEETCAVLNVGKVEPAVMNDRLTGQWTRCSLRYSNRLLCC